MTREIFDGQNLSEEARQVFRDAKTGRLYNPRLNYFDSEHRIYNKAVKELFENFKIRNDIDPVRMIREQAGKFVQEVSTSRHPQIRGFNRHMKMKELLYRVRFGIRGNE